MARPEAPLSPGLWLVATPIGNLGDMTERARLALASADVLCCEDTRRTGALLSHLGLERPRLLVINEHTEHGAIESVLSALGRSEIVVLVSDAGTPALSDPGAGLVRAALDAGHPVRPIPGASALTAALAVSGMDTSRAAFEGFLPRQGAERRRRLAEVGAERRTSVLFEAPHRIARTIADLAEACGADRRVFLAREMTKVHETFWRGTLAEAAEHLAGDEPRGEYVVVLAGAPEDDAGPGDDEIVAAVRRALAGGASRRDAVDAAASLTGAARRRVYELALADAEGAS